MCWVSKQTFSKICTDKYPLLKQIYNEAFEYASTNDNDGVSLKLQPTGLNLS